MPTLSLCMQKFARKLGKAQILTVQQLRSASGPWLHIHDLQHNHRHSFRRSHTNTYSYSRRIRTQVMACTSCAEVIPPCFRGSWVRQLLDGLAELELLPDVGIPEQSIRRTSDEELARHLCQTRAVFPFTVDGTTVNACHPWHRLRRPLKQRLC